MQAQEFLRNIFKHNYNVNNLFEEFIQFLDNNNHSDLVDLFIVDKISKDS